MLDRARWLAELTPAEGWLHNELSNTRRAMVASIPSGWVINGVLHSIVESTMSDKQERSPILWFFGLCGVAALVILTISHLGWNARHRPSFVAGSWYLDDLRTEPDEKLLVTFSSSGELNADSNFGTRWSFSDGKIFFRTWRLSDESGVARRLSNTTLYSYFAETDEFPLTAEFSDDEAVLTLISEDGGPRCRLRRLKP